MSRDYLSAVIGDALQILQCLHFHHGTGQSTEAGVRQLLG